MSGYGTDGLPAEVVAELKAKTWRFWQRQLERAHKREAEKNSRPFIVLRPRLFVAADIDRIRN
jgi:hypothetical protein